MLYSEGYKGKFVLQLTVNNKIDYHAAFWAVKG